MASSIGSTAAHLPEAENEETTEPSMEEILASIKQIIADDETPDDGLTERERYTHPSDHSNSNDTADIEVDMQLALEAEMRSVETPSTDTEPAVASATIKAPAELTLEQRAADVRAKLSAMGAGLSADERLNRYRNPEKLKIETLAEAATKPAATAVPPSSAPPLLTASPILPTSNAVAEAMAATMMLEKSGEIEAMLNDLLRPTVRQWLSDNLPTLVEKLVREEIERVSRGAKAS